MIRLPDFPLIKIETIDNPGWSLDYKISPDDISEESWNTFIKNHTLFKKRVKNDLSDIDVWCTAIGNDIKFTGACGPLNLGDLIDIFLKWYKGLPIPQYSLSSKLVSGDTSKMIELEWLQWFYSTLANNDWEHMHGISLFSDLHGWQLSIDLEDTIYEDEFLIYTSEATNLTLNEDYWIQNKVFYGKGHINKIYEIIKVFREWIIYFDKNKRAVPDKLGKN